MTMASAASRRGPWSKAGALALAGTMLLLSGCGVEGPPPDDADARVTRPSESQSAALVVVNGGTCTPSGAHQAHANVASGCVTCHPCGGALGFLEGATLPSGRALTGTIVHDASGTTCTVTCHTAAGQTPTPISWTATGPFACSSCHAQGLAAPAGGSSHPADNSSVAANRTACQSCHDLGQHVTGTVLINTPTGPVAVPPGGSAEANAACETCHRGNGLVLAGKSPPLLVGWDDVVAGDWHGARAGSGSGGSLASPFVRGQAPLACTACHDPHVSANAFLFTETANGVAVPPATIGRAGVGAERLCSGCHLGNRHAYCTTCHASDPVPAGSPCLTCHGHEPLRRVAIPNAPPHGAGGPPSGSSGCTHCHTEGWTPVAETTPPNITNVQVTNVSSSGATVRWSTSEDASSFVEFGIGSLGQVAGRSDLVRSHEVVLSGLEGPTTYQFRVRSNDLSRNVRLSSVATFVTSDPNAPPAPVLTYEPDVYPQSDIEPVELQWSAVASPIVGNGVQYRLEVRFPDGTLAADSGWIAGTSHTVQLYTQFYGDYYSWRVKARDAVTLAEGSWSNPGSFGVWWW